MELLAGEFVDYGHYKSTIHLRDEKGYVINHKKVYRLMRENKLLVLDRQIFKREAQLGEGTCAGSADGV